MCSDARSLDDQELYARAWLDSEGNVRMSKKVKDGKGRNGVGSAPRSLGDEYDLD